MLQGICEPISKFGGGASYICCDWQLFNCFFIVHIFHYHIVNHIKTINFYNQKTFACSPSDRILHRLHITEMQNFTLQFPITLEMRLELETNFNLVALKVHQHLLICAPLRVKLPFIELTNQCRFPV